MVTEREKLFENKPLEIVADEMAGCEPNSRVDQWAKAEFLLRQTKAQKRIGSGLAIIHLIDSNVFIPIGLDAKVFLNLAPQSFHKFCQAKKDRLFHFLRRDSL